MYSLNEKLMKHQVGYIDTRDEYQKNEILKYTSNATVICYYFLCFACFISLISDILSKKLSLSTPLIFILLLFIHCYSSSLSNKLLKSMYSQYIEVYDEIHFNALIKSLKLKSFHILIILTLSLLMYDIYIGHLIFNEPIELNISDLFGSIAQSIILTAAIYFIGKFMISKKY